MKRKVCGAGALLLLAFLLKYPREALAASTDGMKLWLNTLIPTLLPFLIITGFLLHTDGIEKILFPFQGFFKRIFGLSAGGAYAFLLGLLCGYPMGAKISSDLYQYGKISRREAEYLLTFCNNPSPAFVTTYLVYICLEGRVPVSFCIEIFLLADFFCMVFFRFVIYKNQTCTEKESVSLKKETSTASSTGAIIDVSIMNGFETITRLGGYILMFSLLSACVSHYWPFSPLVKNVVLGFTEITTGLHVLSLSGTEYDVRLFLSMIFTAFGGLCIMAQTRSIMDKRLSFLPYVWGKVLNGALVAVLLLIFV